MPRNGSGVFTMPGATFPVVFNTIATDTAFNANLNDVASALTNSIAVDGQSVITSNIPMNSKKMTGLAAGTVAGDSIEYAQFNDATTRTKSDILNGQFRVAQAGTSFAAPASSAYDIDGWLLIYASSAVVTISQAAGSSTGKLCRLSTVTTADAAVAAGDHVSHSTRIEGYDCVKYLGATFTIGFRVKSAVTGIHCIRIFNGTSTYVAEYTINAANTWEYKTVTIISGTPVINSSTNGVGLYLNWANMCGSTYQTTAGAWQTGDFIGTSSQVNDVATIGNVFGLEDVTLNLGTTVTVNDEPYALALERCQRRFAIDSTYVTATAGNIRPPVFMRAAPTITGGGAGFVVDNGGIGGAVICHQTTASGQTITFNANL